MGKLSSPLRPRTSLLRHGLVAAEAGAIFLAALLPAPSFAEFQLQEWKLHRAEKGEKNLIGGISVFQTDSNRDGSGNVVGIQNLSHYRRTAANLALEWGAHSRITFYGRATWLWNDIEGVGLSANRFGFSDQTIGMAFRLIDRSIAVDFQAQADLAAYSNVQDAGAGRPFLGDSSNDFTVGGFATLPLSANGDRSWQLRGGAGYTFRSGQFSTAVPWSMELLSRPAFRGFTFTAGASGMQSLRNDPRGSEAISASNPSEQARLQSGGSFLVNAVNPSLAAVSASLGYQTDEAAGFHASFRKPVWGQSIADGMTIEAGFRWNLAGASAGPRRAIEARRPERDRELIRYAGDGRVTAVVNTRTLLVGFGSDAGLSMGDLVDIFGVRPDGSAGELIARGQVVHLDIDRAQVSLLEIYQETAIKEGFIARKPIQL